MSHILGPSLRIIQELISVRVCVCVGGGGGHSLSLRLWHVDIYDIYWAARYAPFPRSIFNVLSLSLSLSLSQDRISMNSM